MTRSTVVTEVMAARDCSGAPPSSTEPSRRTTGPMATTEELP
ncbi:hypothetical protein [Nocardioides sp.]